MVDLTPDSGLRTSWAMSKKYRRYSKRDWIDREDEKRTPSRTSVLAGFGTWKSGAWR